MRMQHKWCGLFITAFAFANGCGHDDRVPAPSSAGADPGGAAGAVTAGTGGQSGAASPPSAGGAGGQDVPSDGGGAAGEDPGSGAGAAGIGGAPGASDLPACPSDSLTQPPADFGSVCDPKASWGSPQRVPIAVTALQLVGITPDELTLVVSTPSVMGTAFTVADRAAADAAFDGGLALAPLDYLALSADGLRLIALSADLGSFLEVERTRRGEAFSDPTEGAFSAINADAASSGLEFSGCAVAEDDRTLYYSVSSQRSYSIRISTRSDSGTWPVGEALPACEFRAFDGHGQRPTGISGDGLTLFYFDDARGVEKAAWRASTSEPFSWFVELGNRRAAQVNAECTRLYHTATTGASYSALE